MERFQLTLDRVPLSLDQARVRGSRFIRLGERFQSRFKFRSLRSSDPILTFILNHFSSVIQEQFNDSLRLSSFFIELEEL